MYSPQTITGGSILIYNSTDGRGKKEIIKGVCQAKMAFNQQKKESLFQEIEIDYIIRNIIRDKLGGCGDYREIIII